MRVHRDGRDWRIGTGRDVDWLGRWPAHGTSVTVAVPPVFEAYATVHCADGEDVDAHERAVVRALTSVTAEQPWWLGYLETGAHDVVFPQAPRVPLYWDWPYVLVEAGPEQALSWRRGHMRGDGTVPDLFFPADRSWLVSALWDDGWTCIGGPTAAIDALLAEPATHARRVTTDEDALPPGLVRD